MGFAVPLDMWFRGSLKERIADTVRGPRLSECGVFDPAMLSRMVADHQSGRRDYSSPLWTLLMFDGFLESQSSARPRSAQEEARAPIAASAGA
jgi:asparagine synthase (glutamine-hydrolysing)